MDPRRICETKNRILNPLRLECHDGFSSLERLRDNTWRWCSSRGTLIVTNPTDKMRNVLFNTTFFSGYPEYSLGQFSEVSIIDRGGKN